MTHSDACRSLVHLLAQRAERQPNVTAFRYKSRGLWRSVTWRSLADRVADLAVGLRYQGVRPGTTVAVVGDVSPSWVCSLLAVHAAGARALSLYQSLGTQEIHQLLESQVVSATIVDGLDWPTVLLERGVDLPGQILLDSPESVAGWPRGNVVPLRDVEARGRERRQASADEWERLQRERTPYEPAILFSTAATSGSPKVAAYSSEGLTNAAWAIARAGPGSHPIGAHDTAVVELPTGHVGAVLVAIVLPLLTGMTAHLPEQVLAEAMAEVHPTVSVGLGSTWERWSARIRVAGEETRGLKGIVFRAAQASRSAYQRTAEEGRRASPAMEAANGVAYGGVFLPLISKFGLERLRVALALGPISPLVVGLWRSWGVPLREIYSSTEGGAMVATREGRCFRPAPGVALRVDPEGRLLIKSGALSLGCWTMDALGPARDGGEWLVTDDLAAEVEGGVDLIGHRDDVVASGEGKVALGTIDAALRSSAYIRAAGTVRLASGKLASLLDLDYDAVSHWANLHAVNFRTPATLRESEAVRHLIDREVEAVNASLARRGWPLVATVVLSEHPFVVGRELSPRWAARRRRLHIAASGDVKSAAVEMVSAQPAS